jgi:hypothetical protein
VLSRAVERTKELASRLLSEDAVFTLLQRGLNSTLVARQLFERNIGRLLAGANIPSRRDVDRLIDRVEDLDRELDAIARRVTLLARRARAARSNAPKGASPP